MRHHIIAIMSFGIGLSGIIGLIPSGNASATEDPIGLFTAVHGSVVVTHPAAEPPVMVKLNDQVQFKDRIETRQASRTRALLDDDTALTLGENSRLEITEHLYDPAAKTRSAVLTLIRGKVRALVAQMVGGSKFEIHTPSAIVAARGTYFVVWLEENGDTGVANIGSHGDVAVTSGGREVLVRPGEFSMARKNASPDDPTDSIRSHAAGGAIQATEILDNIVAESSRQTVTALGGTVTTLGTQLLAPVRPVLGALLSAGTPLTEPIGTAVDSTVGTVASVPAVVSGAVNTLNSPLSSALNPVTNTVTTTTRLLGSTGTVTNPIATLTAPLTGPTAPLAPLSPVLGTVTTLLP
jgi:hypothetical protein